MKGFIEITPYDSDKKCLIPISVIKYVIEADNDSAFVATDEYISEYFFKRQATGSGYYTKESYAEIVEKIKQANL